MVKVTLHFIKITIEHRDALLEIVDLLVLRQELAFVGLNIVHEHSLLILTATISCHGLLQSLQKLILGVVKILNKRAHTFDLSIKVCTLLLFGRKVLLALTQVILEALPLVLDQSQHLLEVDDLKLSLVLLVLGLQSRVLTIVDLRVHFGNLLSSLADVLL